MKTLTLPALAMLMASALPAQTGNPLPPRLTGLAMLSVVPPNPPANALRTITFDAVGGCGGETRCPVSMAPVAGAPAYAGGSAYDSSRRVTWASNGKQIAAYFDDLNASCTTSCTVVAVPGLGETEWVTGLGFHDYYQRLYATIVAPGVGGAPPSQRAAWNSITGRCSISAQLNTCALPVPNRVTSGGTAYDYIVGGCDIFERYPVALATGGYIVYGSYFLYTASLWETSIPAGTPRNYLFVNQVDESTMTVCSRRCAEDLVYPDGISGGQPVVLGPITGLALEGAGTAPQGVHRIWATTGSMIVASMPDVPLHTEGNDFEPCSLTYVTTCSATNIAKYVGLTVMPGYTASAGSKCTHPACNNCQLTLTSYGDPNFANPNFGVRVSNAPPNGIGVLLFGDSSCVPATNPHCASEYQPSNLAGNPLAIVPFSIGGAAGPCGGSLDFSMAAGGWTSYLGDTVSVRATVTCSGNPITSNCLVWAWRGH